MKFDIWFPPMFLWALLMFIGIGGTWHKHPPFQVEEGHLLVVHPPEVFTNNNGGFVNIQMPEIYSCTNDIWIYLDKEGRATYTYISPPVPNLAYQFLDALTNTIHQLFKPTRTKL